MPQLYFSTVDGRIFSLTLNRAFISKHTIPSLLFDDPAVLSWGSIGSVGDLLICSGSSGQRLISNMTFDAHRTIACNNWHKMSYATDKSVLIVNDGHTFNAWFPTQCFYPDRKEPVWLITPDITNDELIRALGRLTNLRYDPKTDTVKPLPFKGIPKEWLEEAKP